MRMRLREEMTMPSPSLPDADEASDDALEPSDMLVLRHKSPSRQS
jgi:hypothetical protein